MATQFKHIFLKNTPSALNYEPPRLGRGEELNIPTRNSASWGKILHEKFNEIWAEKERISQTRAAESIQTRTGTYLAFKSALGYDLLTKSLESIGKGIRLLNIQEEIVDTKIQTTAIVYVPNGEEGYFLKKIDEYQKKVTKKGMPRNLKLVNGIEQVELALLEALWTDKKDLIPGETPQWCEVWLNINSNSDLESFVVTLRECRIDFKENRIVFPERIVMLIYASREQLTELMLRSDLLAEIRNAQEAASFWVGQSAAEQQEWIDDVLRRIQIETTNDIKICILDTGVNNGHQLLSPILSDTDTLTVNQLWGTNDHFKNSGHGTLMAGIAGYGDLQHHLTGSNPIILTHKLCSVKILPPETQEATPKELWGDITAQGIYIAEIQSPNSNILYCVSATSTEDVNQGRPSSWSGALDQVAFGEGENQRLILLSAGNVSEDFEQYPNINYEISIHSPAQAWNALTVGGITEKIAIGDDFSGASLVAQRGELSPYSSTSNNWERKWPFKPDVVFEAGNMFRASDNEIIGHPDLEILSTARDFNRAPFNTFNGTSASVSEASWFAAKVVNEYPNAWAETIRGLIVHSSMWSDEMVAQLRVDIRRKTDIRRLLQTYGYGQPTLNKALYSKESALTFIAETEIQPFCYKEKDGNLTSSTETNEMHFFEFPWPKDYLLELGNTPITLRLTLSYFIEPGAGEIGWKEKYRYQSHGLRFDVNRIGESKEAFKGRVNRAAREDDEDNISSVGDDRWVVGSSNRSRGSIHSDIWESTASELSTCNFIAVFPVIGWWRERKHLQKVESKARYSLIVSMETPMEEVELYTKVKNIIETTITIET